jgi:hypothetical protein
MPALHICWAAAAWGWCCLGSRAHAALHRREGSSSPASGSGSAPQATGVRALARQQQQQQQQQAASQRGSARVLAPPLSKRRVGRFSAAAATSLLRRQLSILKRDLQSGAMPITYILLQVSLATTSCTVVLVCTLCLLLLSWDTPCGDCMLTSMAAKIGMRSVGCFVVDPMQVAYAGVHVHIPGKFKEFISTECWAISLIAVCFTMARCWAAWRHIRAYALRLLHCLVQLRMLWSAVRAQAASEGQGRHKGESQATASQVSQRSGQSQVTESRHQQKDNTQQSGPSQSHHHQQMAGDEASSVQVLLQRCRAWAWVPVAWVLRGSLHLATTAGLGALHYVRVLAAAGSAVWQCGCRTTAITAAAPESWAQTVHRCLISMGSNIHRSVTSSNVSQDQEISSSGGSTGSREPALTSCVSGPPGGGKQKGQKQGQGGSLHKRPSKSDQDSQQQVQAVPQQQDRRTGAQQGPSRGQE